MREFWRFIPVRKKPLYIIAGVIVLLLIVVGVGSIAFLITIEIANAQRAAAPTPTVQVPTTPTTKASGIGKTLKQYAPAIKTQLAQSLSLSPAQLTADLQSGKTLTDIAAAQNVSSTQLQTNVANALQTALKPAVDDGTLTQQQVDKFVKKAQGNPNSLDRLLGGKAVPQVTPTPGQ